MFQEIERVRNLSDRVTDEIEAWVIRQGLQPGDRLPAERVLADEFGVSRTVIREAVRALGARGLLAVHPGSRTVVTRPTPRLVSKSITRLLGLGVSDPSFLKVLEVRRSLEVEVAALAAARRTAADIDALEASCADLRDGQSDAAAFARADMAFHLALAAATQNELYVLLMESIAELLLEMRRKAFDLPGTAARALMHHEKIMATVIAGDADGARRAMEEHLMEAQMTQERLSAELADAPQGSDRS